VQIFKIIKANETGDQESEVSGDGMTGVAVQLFAPHGHAYRPKAGQLSFSFSVDGDEGNAAHIAPQAKVDLKLSEGESAFGNFEAKCYAVFKNDGTIVFKAKKVIFESDVETTGTTKALDFIESTNNKTFVTHLHSGVLPGGGNSGGVI
jgi:hypothetical protein